MTFGDRNTGSFTFTSEGKIIGNMSGDLCKNFTFSGQSQKAPKKSSAEARQVVSAWKSEWRSINATNYEVANSSRWGGWGGETREENPAESDTTVGYRPSDDDMDDEDEYDYDPDCAY